MLTFEGGSAVGNHGDGLDLGNVPAGTAAHVVIALVANASGFDGATANGHNGIIVGRNAGLKLRISVARKNGGSGIVWLRSTAASSALDIGTVADSGGNSLGGPTVADLNLKAALCLDAPPATVAAEGNKWSTCPPTQKTVTDCTASFTYADIATKSAAAVVVTTTSCAVGP